MGCGASKSEPHDSVLNERQTEASPAGPLSKAELAARILGSSEAETFQLGPKSAFRYG